MGIEELGRVERRDGRVEKKERMGIIIFQCKKHLIEMSVVHMLEE